MKRGLDPELVKHSPFFSSAELERYSRHFHLPKVGKAGQQKLKAARVLCVGAGGLGSASLLYLAAAGIGTLGIIDDDAVELSNLQRQILYTEKDIKSQKATAAKSHLTALNSSIDIEPYEIRLTHENALNIIHSYDIVLDGSDNFATRYLVNDACFHLKKPNIHASIFQFTGQCSLFIAENGPCYRCLYDTSLEGMFIPNCAEGGVLGILPGLMGCIQAAEVIKLILGIGTSLTGKILQIDLLTMQFQEFILNKNPDCCLCVKHQSFDSLRPYHETAVCTPKPSDEISVGELYAMRIKQREFILLDVREPQEYQICHLNGKLIPLAQLEDRLNELDKTKLIIVYCYSGGRSRKAVELLRATGFTSVKSLTGGIAAWQKQIDPSMPIY